MDQRTSAERPGPRPATTRRGKRTRAAIVALAAVGMAAGTAGTVELASAASHSDRTEYQASKRASWRWRKKVSRYAPKSWETTTTTAAPTTTAPPATTAAPTTAAPTTATPTTAAPSRSTTTAPTTTAPTTTAPAPAAPGPVAPSPGTGTGRVLYVSQSGSDSGSGAESSPFRTVAKGMSALGPGDTLLVRQGTYVENIRSPRIAQGTSSARIRVAAYPGERPVIQGLLWLTQPSYWTLDGLRVTWNPANAANEHMVKLTNGVGWELINSELYGARSYAALLVAEYGGELRDWRVADNCIRDTQPSNNVNQDHLVYVNSGSGDTNGVIEHNLLFNAVNGEGVKLGGVSAAEAVQGITVQNNTIANTSQSVLVAGSSRDVVIDRNIMAGTTNGRNHVRGYGDSGAQVQVTGNVYFDQNLFVWSDSGAIQPGAGNQERDPRFSSTGCNGFVPTDSAAAAVGRWAK